MLKFGRGNAKLDALESVVGGQVWTFSLLSGFTCPFAKQCLSRAIRTDDGKSHIEDGKHTEFRCFSASQEALFPEVYNSRKYNTDAIKACGGNLHKMTELILDSLPSKAKCIRIHVGGDFNTPTYFRAWCDVARLKSDVLFYAYTKSLIYWLNNAHIVPANLVLTASRGGYQDTLIEQHNLREAVVVFSEAEAAEKGLEIDHDDSHAALPALRNQSFALLIHGAQPAGSDAGKAVRKLKGVGSYGKRAKV